MKKRTYIIPRIDIEIIEVEQMIAASRVDTVVKNAAGDSDEIINGPNGTNENDDPTNPPTSGDAKKGFLGTWSFEDDYQDEY